MVSVRGIVTSVCLFRQTESQPDEINQAIFDPALSDSIVVRARQKPGLTLVDYLENLDGSLKNALVHQDHPLSEIKKTLADRQEKTATSLNQVSFSMFLPKRQIGLDAAHLFRNFPGARVEIGDMFAETVVLPARGRRRDLSAVAQEAGDKMFMRFDYDASLCRLGTIESMARDYAAIARAAVEDPTALIDEIAVADAGQCRPEDINLDPLQNERAKRASRTQLRQRPHPVEPAERSTPSQLPSTEDGRMQDIKGTRDPNPNSASLRLKMARHQALSGGYIGSSGQPGGDDGLLSGTRG